MKILKLIAENVKKLRVVEITPGGNIVQITGPNSSGKSSVLDAIFYALAGTGTIPHDVIRRGEERARVTLDLGEVMVTRRFTQGGGTSLVVEAANKARFTSPQTMLDGLLGKLSFDPLAFARMRPVEQLEELKRLVPLSVDLAQLEAENAEDFARRTALNRAIRNREGELAALPVFSDGTPTEEINPEALTDELEAAGVKNTERERDLASIRSRIDHHHARLRKVSNLRTKAAELRRDADKFEKEASELEDDATKQITQLSESLAALPEVIDTTPLKEQLKQARDTNLLVRAARQASKLREEIARLAQESGELTTRMAERDRIKTDAIAQAQMPVPGLSFGQCEVRYNDLPLENAGDAERLRISVAIAMAANPQLRVIRIKDGSLLDEHGLKVIAEMATTTDYQVWIERVDTSGRVGIVMEDGKVRSGGEPIVEDSPQGET